MLDKDVVKRRLAALGVESQEAARRAKMTKQTWWNIMHGDGNVRAETLYRIAAALECSPCDLLVDGRKRITKPK
jgi:DNA-binding Xre family transcriptional regulator